MSPRSVVLNKSTAVWFIKVTTVLERIRLQLMHLLLVPLARLT